MSVERRGPIRLVNELLTRIKVEVPEGHKLGSGRGAAGAAFTAGLAGLAQFSWWVIAGCSWSL